ncbi:hypothetical protein BGX29_010967 [Mortierella sp. GBA35]|nr:hypothetical protein BGX29_010967 [Mortierella sp. GBA35]
MNMNNGPQHPSSYITAITTTTGNDIASNEPSIIQILQSELNRKLEELYDIQKAYAETLIHKSNMTPPSAPLEHCFQVQRAWSLAVDVFEHRAFLYDAVVLLECEIGNIREDLAAALRVAFGGHN